MGEFRGRRRVSFVGRPFLLLVFFASPSLSVVRLPVRLLFFLP